LFNLQRKRAEKAQLEILELKKDLEKMKLQITHNQMEMKLQVENALMKLKAVVYAKPRRRNEMLSIELEESKSAELELLKMNEQLACKLNKSQKAVGDIKGKLQRSEMKNKAQRYNYQCLWNNFAQIKYCVFSEHLASREVYWETICEELRRHNKNLMRYIEIFGKVIDVS